MTEYLITFNDEWVPEHSPEQVQQKAEAVRPLIDEMLAEGVLIFGNGGLDRSTAVCGVEPGADGPVFTDGPYAETKEHLGGFVVVDVPDDASARYWAGRLTTVLEWPHEVHRFRGPGRGR
ncbi:YciI family protein [Actinoplanes sp. NPDC023801]|uniref:YciI family protein n=1 Tax=Actinoplanes sp. NPDC023801 TaxID=3154595 RepID=UPI0033C5F1D6